MDIQFVLDVYAYVQCISKRFRKSVLARFSRGFGLRPNPGLAGNSNPRGGSVKARLGKWSRPWAGLFKARLS